MDQFPGATANQARQDSSPQNAAGNQSKLKQVLEEGGLGGGSAPTNKILFLIAACNDNYIRFFNLQALKMSLAFKGKDHNGQPLCFDVSADRQLIAIGFEDDSFITYYLEVKDQGLTIDIIPIMRGVGHRNFVSTLKFDSFFQINH